jgi:hypothetical protein
MLIYVPFLVYPVILFCMMNIVIIVYKWVSVCGNPITITITITIATTTTTGSNQSTYIPRSISPVTPTPIITMIQSIWRYRNFGIAMSSPLFLYWLFSNQANGTILQDSYIANLSKYQYGIDPIFTHYIDTTPKLFPW